MSSPQILTLFGEPQFQARGYGFLASLVVHGAGSIAISLGMLRNPPVIQASLHSFYPVRLVSVSTATDAERSAQLYTPPLPWNSLEPDQSQPGSVADGTSPSAHRMRRTQVLLQAETPVVQIHDEVAPSLMIVAAKPVNISPIEEPSRPDTGSAAVQPKLELPNGESRPAELNLTPSRSAAENPAILSGSTTPVAIAGLSNQAIPGPLSESTPHSAFARIVSISEQQLVSGAVVLPEVSVVPSEVSFEREGQGQSSAAHGHSLTDNRAQGRGNGEKTNVSVKRITLPRNGHFPVVLVGDSIQENYPEIAGTWRGRLAYTVYLPVDAGKRWVLQYSVLPANQRAGIMSGARPEAPWPVDMLVPNLDAYLTGIGAVIVHGVISPAGRFDDLTVAYPPQFSQEAVLLDSLNRWIFRPAAQKGRPAGVEILLVIPGSE